MRKQETKIENKINSLDAPKRPIKKWRSGNVEVAIWLNKRDLQDGTEVEFKTVSLSRSYRKRDEGVWRSDVINLRRNDLQKVILVLEKAQEDLLLTDEGGDDNDE